MYFFYTYKWKVKYSDVWQYEMDVFKGSFSQLILMAYNQPEHWVIDYTKEIDEDTFNDLDGVIG